MVLKKRTLIGISKIYLIITIIWIIIIKIKSFKLFKAFNLLSNDIILITDEGILKYTPETNNQTMVLPTPDLINQENFLDYISFAQSQLEEGGYIFCRLQDSIYIFDQTLSTFYGNFSIEFSYSYYVLTPYKNNKDENTIIISYIKEQKIRILMYKINFNEPDILGVLANEASKQVKNEEGYLVGIYSNGIACELISSSNYANKLLTCFVLDMNSYSMVSATFDPESSLSLLYYSNNYKKTKGASLIKSASSPNKKTILVCFVDTSCQYLCLLYDSENNELSDLIKMFGNCNLYRHNTGVKYISEKNEYAAFCSTNSNEMNFIKLDENFNPKETDENNNKCYHYFLITNEQCYTAYSSYLLYVKNTGHYYMFRSCYSIDNDGELKLLNISETCNIIEVNELKNNSQSISSTKPMVSSLSTIKMTSISSLSLISSTTLITLSTSSTTSTSLDISQKNNNNLIKIYYEDEIITKGTINKEKKELETNLEEIMENIEIGKRYEINGIDYNFTITPINDLYKFSSTFVDLTICEKILRKEYNISSDEILTILQIEIDKTNEKALTSQVEYIIYNDKKEKLDLSYCKDVQIKINYDIKNKDLLNKTMIDYYSSLGIDIFDINDSFFNDLCYPFSIDNSDVILKDRVLDIYQNYSLCDNGCEYDNIDVENMTVSCSCQIKTKVNTEVSKPIFAKIVEYTFKDSNFGVVRCYNLVFSLDYKFHNIGFLLFIVFVIFHIICYMYYFINGIKSVVIFVYKEMEKNNYISRISNPKKKKLFKDKTSQNKSNSHNELNSQNNSINNEFFENINNKLCIDLKKKKKEKKQISKKEKKLNNKPIIIFNNNYYNNYYKLNDKIYNSNKNIFRDSKETKNFKIINNNTKRKKLKINLNKLNEEKNCPGYYNLIQLNANNSLNNHPPKSKYILDNYNFEEAIKYDKRDFWRIYFICLLSKENILNTFFFKAPLELQPLRLSIFIFSYSCDFALNALFYLNEKISDKYHYEGESLYIFTLINNMTVSIFSTVSSYLLVKSLNLLTDSKDQIEDLFRVEEKKMRKNINYRVSNIKKKNIYIQLFKIYKCMKIKIICYIIIELIIMLFFHYYITAFCEVYRDTQVSWLYDSFVSFLLSFPIELLISFCISLLYIIAIKRKNKFLYKLILFLYGLG